MMGYCYIDGLDIYEEFGAIVEGDGYDDLFLFPAIKEPDKNNWPEENGIEVDLSEPRLQSRAVTMDFAAIGHQRWQHFFEFISSPGYRTINIPSLGICRQMRVSEMPRLETYEGVDMLSVKFVEDEPQIPQDYPDAETDIGLPCPITLDGKQLDRYGIIVKGGLDDLERSPKLKNQLLRTNCLLNGQIYDAGDVRFDEKEVTFECCLSATQIDVFWNLYNAFFGDLLKQGLRQIGYRGRSYPAFYRKTDNCRLDAHYGQVVCEFDLTLCFTAFVVAGIFYLLSTEDGKVLTTEDGLYIDLEH